MEHSFYYLFIFLSEAVINWQYFERLFLKKRPQTIIALSFGYIYFGLFFVYLLQQPLLNTLGFALANCALLLINYTANWKQAVLHAAFLTSIMVASEMLCLWNIDYFLSPVVSHMNDPIFRILLFIPSKLLYLFISAASSMLFCKKDISVLNSCFSIPLCILPILSIGVSYFSFRIGFYTSPPEAAKNLMLIIVCMLLTVNLFFILLHYQMQKVSARQMQLQLRLQKEQADVVYYQALQAQDEQQRILLHDIKNHLQAIHVIAQNDKDTAVTDYIETILEDMHSIQPARLCTDTILNSILLHASEQCREKQIDFLCDVRENCTAFMDPPSLTTLYSNLLSNAIEAAENSQEKFIELSVTQRMEQGQVIISVINSCTHAPVPDEEGGFLSNKPNKTMHGLGLKSIHRIVKQYRGDSVVYYDKTGNQFHHILRFPL